MKETFLDTSYVTIPIEQHEDLIRDSERLRIVKEAIAIEKCISIKLLCAIIGIPVPADFRSAKEILEEIDHDLVV